MSEEEFEKLDIETDSPNWESEGTCTTCYRCIALAVSRHLLEYLKEPCSKHTDDEADTADYPHRYLCPDCMAEIEKEIG